MVSVGRYIGHVRYDSVINLFFWGGRGKEKLWAQILHRLSIINYQNVVWPKTGIITYGIVSTRTLCAFDLFRCGLLQHRMWPKATKSILNPPACANW